METLHRVSAAYLPIVLTEKDVGLWFPSNKTVVTVKLNYARAILSQHLQVMFCYTYDFSMPMLPGQPTSQYRKCIHHIVCRADFRNVIRSSYLSLPHPCPQFSTTKSLQKTHHQILGRSAMRWWITGMNLSRKWELCTGEQPPPASCHFMSPRSSPVQLSGSFSSQTRSIEIQLKTLSGNFSHVWRSVTSFIYAKHMKQYWNIKTIAVP